MQLLFGYSTEQPHISKVKKNYHRILILTGLEEGEWGGGREESEPKVEILK